MNNCHVISSPLAGSWHPPAAKRNPREEFEQHHIPGAVFADVEAIKDNSNPLPIMLPPPEQLEQQFSQVGRLRTPYHLHGYNVLHAQCVLALPRD